MKMLQKIRTAKKMLYYLIVGLILAVLFVFLLLINHLNRMRINNAFKNLNKESDYKIVLKNAYNCESKRFNLFTYQNIEFTGVCIKKIYISYNDTTISLKKVLEKGYLNWEDILGNSTLISKSDKIEQYQANGPYTISIYETSKKDKEIVFSY